MPLKMFCMGLYQVDSKHGVLHSPLAKCTSARAHLQVTYVTQLTELVIVKEPGLLPEFLPEMAALQVCVRACLCVCCECLEVCLRGNGGRVCGSARFWIFYLCTHEFCSLSA